MGDDLLRPDTSGSESVYQTQFCKKVQQNLITPDLCQFTNRLNSLSLKFDELTLTVKKGGCFKKERLTILDRLSGKFESQELIAIFGPSGSGKSSLMNVLAGYRDHGITGSIMLNGAKRDANTFKKLSCYIMQDDCLPPYLTVKEAMMVSANLKLESNVPKTLRRAIVDEILQMLGLEKRANTFTRSLSGGQRKRLAVALELVNNPPVMFLDEPTSGLDSSTSYQVISLLKVLAHEGRMIICSIHQPSARLFEQFDHIYVLCNGECLYRGNVPSVVPFLLNHDLECPRYHNPADFVIEVASGDYGDVMDGLVDGVRSGECEELGEQFPHIMEYCPNFRSLWQSMEKSGHRGFDNPPGTQLGKLSKIKKPQRNKIHDYTATSWKQFRILFWRMTLSTIRDPSLTHMRLMSHVVIAILLGLLYYQVGNKAERVQDNIGYCFFCLLFVMFASLMPVLLSIHLEMPIFIRENMNFWYTVDSYFMARTASDVPFQIFYPLVYCAISYYMSGQPDDMERFGMFCFVFVELSLVSQAFGLLVGAASPTAEFATFTGPIVMIPLTLFSGFFVKFDSIPVYMEWCSYVSYQRYAYEAIVVSLYGNDRPLLTCHDKTRIHCRLQNGTIILDTLDVDEDSYWRNVAILGVFFLLLRVLCYIAFRIRIKVQRF